MRKRQGEKKGKKKVYKNTFKIKKAEKEKPLVFFLSLGDGNPIIYTIGVAFNPNKKPENVTKNIYKNLVEETNIALKPVYDKFNEILLPFVKEDSIVKEGEKNV